MGKKIDEKNQTSNPPASSPDAPPAPPEEKTEASKPATELETLQAKLVEYEDHLQRLAAEFDNYKKRVEKEKAAARTHGKAEAMAPFIDMMETFEQALAHAEKASNGAGDAEGQTVGSKAMHDGFKLLHKKLQSIFASLGVREIECKGHPHHAYHEVMLKVSGGRAGEIAQTLRKGYVMGEHVLRPAQVSVYIGEEKNEKDVDGKKIEKTESE